MCVQPAGQRGVNHLAHVVSHANGPREDMAAPAWPLVRLSLEFAKVCE